MSNIVLIIAGGSSNRMGQDIPKQFMHIDGAPVIIHTMKAFEQHPDIDGIAVVCLHGWDTVLQSYANQFNITKFKWIFPGGKTGMEVADAALQCHKSQQPVGFYASYHAPYDCRDFGLYATTVGEDVLKNDFLENISLQDGK